MRNDLILSIAGATVMIVSGARAAAADAPLSAVPFTAVKVEGGFWAPWLALTRAQILPHNLEFCESEGKVDNFRVQAGRIEGKHKGAPWEDSDVYKVIEGAAYCLALEPDPELERRIDELIELIAASQLPDGYLHTYFSLGDIKQRWTDDSKHETYCAGHMIEAAVAYFQATGKRTFLDVAIRFANHMYAVFGPNGQTDVSEHEEIELALMKLWRVTNDDRYRELAQLFVDRRGHYQGRKCVPEGNRSAWGDYCQDGKPVCEQTEISGHAVRAMYLYSGVTDLAAVTGNPGYNTMLDHVWEDVTQRKIYVTGGLGPSAHNEGFTVAYDLPNDSAYAETCASVGMALWSQRMALLRADARYADMVELEIYNGLLSGVAMDGRRFFYVNRLEGREHRPAWHGCSCCPTNIVRFLPAIAGYAYATGPDALYVNQFMAGQASVDVAGVSVAVRQETKYPWEGDVRLTVTPASPASFALMLRVPGWCQGPQSPDDLYTIEGKPASGAISVKVNGEAVAEPVIEKGYVRLARVWAAGDTVEYAMDMPVRRVKAHPNVAADTGRVALRRGPVIFCLESVDNGNLIRSMTLPPDAPLTVEFRPDLLGGVTVIRGTAQTRFAGQDAITPAEITAVPYYAWDNRTVGYMRVWLPESLDLATPRPVPTAASESVPSTSHANNDTPDALNDQIEPANSCDLAIPRLTWWDHKGGREWAQYDFDKPRAVRGVAVYWFDDTGKGSCRVPRSWRILYKSGSDWKPVENASDCGVKPDTFNEVTFAPVTTDGLRLDVGLQKDFSGGILEWKVIE